MALTLSEVDHREEACEVCGKMAIVHSTPAYGERLKMCDGCRLLLYGEGMVGPKGFFGFDAFGSVI